MEKSYDKELRIFKKAVEFAQERGYEMPSLEYAVLFKSRPHGWSNSLRMWATGLIYEEDFLKAFFGDEPVEQEYDTDLMYRIEMWAKQIAVEYNEQLYAIPDNHKHRYISFGHYTDAAYGLKPPNELVESQIVTKQIIDMVSSLCVRTHRLDKVSVSHIKPNVPAWKHHKLIMAQCYSPFVYIESYMDLQNGGNK